MSSEELPGPVAPPDRLFAADRPKNGRAKCKRCKEPVEAGKLRIAKIVPNAFSASGGWAKQWFHPACLWEAFSKQRPSTKKIEDPEGDIEGWEDLIQEDMDEIVAYLRSTGANPPSPRATRKEGDATPKAKKPRAKKEVKEAKPVTPPPPPPPSKDDYFRAFRKLCVDLSAEPSYLAKTALVTKVFTEGTDGGGFKGDLEVWTRLLLPMVEKRIYNLQSKQLVKLFSKIFETDEDAMLEDLTQGDVAETIKIFFDQSKSFKPTGKSNILIAEVDEFLEKLATMTREEEQSYHLKQVAKKCTSNDLKMIIRLVKHDLRINAGPKHILAAIHPDAYAAFQTSRDLRAVVRKALLDKGQPSSASSSGASASGASGSGSFSISISLLTPVLPMLAEACKSVEQAMKKCPNGMYSEIKYDGERVQVHKQGDEFKYYSRALKPVLAHKVNHFKQYIPDAFPSGEDLILDSEILLIDNKTGKPLPFGSLGVHKQSAFQDANVCLFVFDCMFYNGESLLHKTMKQRRKILEKVMVEIPNRILFSEQKEIHRPEDLTAMMEKVFRLGLEGLVLKDLQGPYEPGKRHWLKVKKDYLFGGAMADTADLVVLGAFYGTGQKGGMMSIFLMGCYDPATRRWCTVTKVHGGHDDETLARLQTELKMVKIHKDPGKIPDWLKANKQMYPDFVAVDPKDTQVWEITGAEFTQTEVHTADGISVRFPRVTRIRDDKTWEQATSLPELRALFKKSKETADFSLSAMAGASGSMSSSSASPSKTTSPRKASPQKTSPRKTTTKEAQKRPRSDSNSPERAKKSGPSKPLPDVFLGITMRAPPFMDRDSEFNLRRYIVAYGGNLIARHSKELAVFTLHSSDETFSGVSDEGLDVDVEWVWDCIRKGELLPAQRYTTYGYRGGYKGYRGRTPDSDESNGLMDFY
ncbi:DNA ligase 3 [Frankliniella occidentalis]|uniref:DNA ligase n=1 Tax=Frankliniella occidentalis TaxID=133901 RepID=A0A6J1SL29_FRAOC|nr:DNA ligase 3 [Frankliniella occidentalis]